MIDWSRIDTVLLDMDGTLLDLHFDSHFWLEHLPKRYAELHKLDAASARARVSEAIRAQEGTLNWYSLDYWSREFQVDIVALKREIQHLIGFRADAADFLRQLQDSRHRVVLATNADRHSLELKLAATGLDEYVDRIICSHDLRYPKEDTAFWHALQAIEPFDPERTLLIDDNQRVLHSARQYGIAWLLCITQPDSQSPERAITEYPAIQQFCEIRPKRR